MTNMYNAEILFQYWGKALKGEEKSATCHLLPYHSLDVAATAFSWWKYSGVIRQLFVYETDSSEEVARAWTLFFVALHDYGKWDIRFQLKAPEALSALFPEFESEMVMAERRYDHGPAGYGWFCECDSYDLGLSDLTLDAWMPWLRAVTGHHGNLPDDPGATDLMAEDCIIERDRHARVSWIQTLVSLFLEPVGLDLTHVPPDCPDLLAGFCAVCDWLGSNEQHFYYQTERYELPDYWKWACQRADEALASSGLYRDPLSPGGMSQLFPGMQPRSLQRVAAELPLAPGLTLVEAPTGSGKTELALAYASRLLAAGVGESIVFALPTQATANVMLERLERVATALFADGPNVVLAHGKARYNANFDALKQAAKRSTVQTDDAERDASVQCVQWLGASRKRVFLGQIGVCTVDQVLLSVLPVRHQFVRAFGVRKSVLIIDEVHAYDAYMYGLLGQVLQGQQRSGGSALLLSATLPLQQKQMLMAAWGRELASEEAPETAAYPLITQCVNDSAPVTRGLEEAEQPEPRAVRIETCVSSDMQPDEALCQRIIDAADRGALVGVVCNLVAVAQLLAMKLREMTELPVDLFHARFRFEDRQAHEAHVMACYGNRETRGQGRILVATQVIEQSLDLDFDWMVSQLCPVDLLFQRMGRLHRHDRESRPLGFASPSCTILLPPSGASFGLHAVVYGCERVLWRTQQMLMAHDEIVFPRAYRSWIEHVYHVDAWPDEPEAITAAYDAFALENQGRFYSARQLSKSDATPFEDTEGAAAKLTRDGDSSLSVLLVEHTSAGFALLSGQRLDDLGEDERDEALDLNSVNVPPSWHKWLGEADREGRYRLELQHKGDNVWEAEQHGKPFRYRRDLGLMMD